MGEENLGGLLGGVLEDLPEEEERRECYELTFVAWRLDISEPLNLALEPALNQLQLFPINPLTNKAARSKRLRPI